VQEQLTPNYYANELRLRRSTHKGVFLLVEGGSDAKFYRQLIDSDQCQLVVALNRDMAISVLEILQKDPSEDVVAIVDKDFDELNGTLPDRPNLFFTDTHDLETMLIQSPALEKLLSELGSKEKLSKFGHDVRAVLLAAGCAIGYLLWVSLQDDLSLKFEGIDFPKFINRELLTIDELELIEEVKRKSQKPKLKTSDLHQRMTQKKHPSHDPWQVCRGHDLMYILSVGLRHAIGTKDAKDVTVEILESNLRMCHEQVYFQATQLYSSLNQWETDNPTYKILKRK
jgi:Protein of unknown function (DUF4435)